MSSPVFRSLAVGLFLVASLRAENPLFRGIRNPPALRDALAGVGVPVFCAA